MPPRPRLPSGGGRRADRPREVPIIGGTVERTDPLTGEVIEGSYRGVRERFTLPATSIWRLGRNEQQIRLRALVGDEGQERADSFMSVNGKPGTWLPSSKGSDRRLPGQRAGDAAPGSRAAPDREERAAASIFNPVLAGLLVEAYSPPGGFVIDPFAGGGTRAVLAGTLGRKYHGVDVRKPEVVRVNQRLAELELAGCAVATGSSVNYKWPRRKADALITCPPYWNLEVYSEDPEDLSTTPTYEVFLDGIESVIKNYVRALKSGAFVVWVAGRFRHPQTGFLLDFPADLVRLHGYAGFGFYDQVIYTHDNPQAFYRQGLFDRTRKVVRVHEDVLVFVAP